MDIVFLCVVFFAFLYGVVAGIEGLTLWRRHKEHKERMQRYHSWLERERAANGGRHLELPDEC